VPEVYVEIFSENFEGFGGGAGLADGDAVGCGTVCAPAPGLNTASPHRIVAAAKSGTA
jgi:hypothetical protein